MRKTGKLAYTAGIMDGEGSIYIRRTTKGHSSSSLAVFVTNTNEWICQWLKFQYGGSIQIMQPRKKNWKIAYRWWLTSNQALGFLKLILPYLNLKRPQAELAITFQERKQKRGYGSLTEMDKTLIEADRILMQSFNRKGI